MKDKPWKIYSNPKTGEFFLLIPSDLLDSYTKIALNIGASQEPKITNARYSGRVAGDVVDLELDARVVFRAMAKALTENYSK